MLYNVIVWVLYAAWLYLLYSPIGQAHPNLMLGGIVLFTLVVTAYYAHRKFVVIPRRLRRLHIYH